MARSGDGAADGGGGGEAAARVSGRPSRPRGGDASARSFSEKESERDSLALGLSISLMLPPHVLTFLLVIRLSLIALMKSLANLDMRINK